MQIFKPTHGVSLSGLSQSRNRTPSAEISRLRGTPELHGIPNFCRSSCQW